MFYILTFFLRKTIELRLNSYRKCFSFSENNGDSVFHKIDSLYNGSPYKKWLQICYNKMVDKHKYIGVM